MKLISVVTGGIKCKDGTELTSIFIYKTPKHTSGFTVYLPDADIVETDMFVGKLREEIWFVLIKSFKISSQHC